MTAWSSISEGSAGAPRVESAWSREEFERQLRGLGRYYHFHHPYQKMMAAGELNHEQMQGWVINRFYYQISIPRKDAAVLANCPDREVRRRWIQRIIDHDGSDTHPGGIEAWLRLGDAVGVSRQRMTSLEEVLPGVRFAVDAYLNFARSQPWQEAVCSSLTELFAPDAHRSRLDTWPQHYPWVDPAGLAYFENRLAQAREDVKHGLALTLEVFDTRDRQERALEVLRFKLDVLWAMLDAMYLAYVVGMPPYHALQENQ
ncbi:pyrroloquinoline-quinone synthase PqqC [Aquisalimonas sp.]|uniref:pyrroloquinoline-quinone synthase PqqC n=1 Tax=Aquisalimonas sp. TaxID=1872621 RepID=UPI0025BDB385|nr:pyrroloquinoline-quinone synthase PqqC [Aquisalimonas sp.]